MGHRDEMGGQVSGVALRCGGDGGGGVGGNEGDSQGRPGTARDVDSIAWARDRVN